MAQGSYYVYVYIDPRNFEEFYYGKGRGSRKNAHLFEDSDSEKSKRINAIHKAGLKPIVRVIARNLSEHDALLVEKTLLWKLGRQLTNISSGHYSQNFRRHNTLHAELSGFDFEKGIYYYNVGDGPTRCWEDYVQFGFISAGQATRFRDAMLGFQPGDIVAAYLKRHGFVGIGRIKQRAKPVREVTINGLPLLKHELSRPGLASNVDSNETCEYVAITEWIKTVNRSEAKWKPKSGLYTTTHVRASLDSQPKTIEFLESEFGIDLKALVA
ncbi:MAG: hypothetical protein CMN28_12905 [Salinisphaeraceae bacterium]|nr:hypothetical protein [Salinisphaeraceae bacterium]